MLNSLFTTTHLQTSRKLHQELPFPSETFQHQLQIWLQNSPCLWYLPMILLFEVFGGLSLF